MLAEISKCAWGWVFISGILLGEPYIVSGIEETARAMSLLESRIRSLLLDFCS
jgi:hypothetical protein